MSTYNTKRTIQSPLERGGLAEGEVGVCLDISTNKTLIKKNRVCLDISTNKTLHQQAKRTSILALLLLLTTGNYLLAQEQHPAEKYGWGFVNFGTPSFGWDIYRNSFYGIPVDSNTSWFTAPFDKLFYDLAFETTLADPSGTGGGAGNCFGLSILSMMINNFGGYKGFCAPTIQYTNVDGSGAPTTPGLLRAINIMHGHQISLLFIQSVIEQVNGGHALDAAYGVTRATQTLGREGPFLLSVTKSLLPTDGGHAIIGYDVINEGGGNYKIMVVDPNRIWADTSMNHRGWYTSNSNFVQVNGHDWSFMMAGKVVAWPTEGRDDTIPGGTPGSGNLTIYPLSIAGPTSRTPSSLGLGVTSLLSQIFIMNKDGALGGRIEQVTNGKGKRLFADPAKYIVDSDTTTGIGKMTPFYPMGVPPNGGKWPFELYFHNGPLNQAAVEFNTGEGNAEIVAGDNRGYVRVRCDEPGVSGRLRYSGLGGAEPTVIIENTSAPITVEVELLVAIQPGTTNRVWKLEGVEIPAQTSESIRLSVDAYGGTTVRGASSKSAQLHYTQSSLQDGKNFCAEGVSVVPATGARIERAGWVERNGLPGE